MGKTEVSRIQGQIATFSKQCSKSFELLGDRSIRFGEPRPVAGQKMLVQLNGPGSVTARTDKYTYAALPFPVSDLKLFWLAATLEFKTNRNIVTPDSATMIIFTGEAYNSDKQPLLRAEWESNAASPHAQPHWHVYNSRVGSIAKESELFDTAPAFDPSESITTSINDYVPKFHFAMCASWSSNNSNCVQAIQDEQCVADWLSHTLRYIQGQLVYTMRRHG
ncbi:MAG: hypothetical protein KF905_04040 [Flavobacteriales bacterium]|nr:hypothetical protein [Flavobacteriales bacterium]